MHEGGEVEVTGSVSCAVRLVGQLVAQGMREAVLCPGSRSAPLAFALEAHPQVRLHVRVDERSAGFLALGLAKATGRPVAVATTSGTAVGNLLPAVMEASHAHVPLVVVSADRPGWLVGSGANQTTTQVGLYGGFVRASERIADTWPAEAVSAAVVRAVAGALGTLSRRPGPVHLNVEFAEPLVPAEGEPLVADVAPVRVADVAAGEALELDGDRRTVIVAGDAAPEEGARIAELARSGGVPLIAEPSSNARHAALVAGLALLATPLAEGIERVILAGHPTLTRPVTRLLARSDVEVIAWTPFADWPDPGARVSTVAAALTLASGDPAWLSEWVAADSRAGAAARGRDASGTGPAVVADVLAHTSGPLILGSSALIRDAFALPWPQARPVFANRGLAGIDGTVSTAIGVALGLGTSATLVCGDLTFLHDLNGLAIGPGEPRPDLRILVGDDRGGSIFRLLEPGAPRFAATFDRLFATPTGVDLATAARGYGVDARRVEPGGLADALADGPNGIEVLVVPLAPRH